MSIDNCPNCKKAIAAKFPRQCVSCGIEIGYNLLWKDFVYDEKGVAGIEWYSDGTCSIYNNNGIIIMNFNYHLPYDIDRARIEKLLLLV